MLLTTNSFVCNASTAPQFIMANQASATPVDRSRSPAGSKGDGIKGADVELDEKFLALWSKHVEPKMVEKNKEFEKE